MDLQRPIDVHGFATAVRHPDEWVVNANPRSLKLATAAGIGLFVAFIGLNAAGIIAPRTGPAAAPPVTGAPDVLFPQSTMAIAPDQGETTIWSSAEMTKVAQELEARARRGQPISAPKTGHRGNPMPTPAFETLRTLRVDQIGGLSRPDYLREMRARFEKGEASAAEHAAACWAAGDERGGWQCADD